MQLEPEAKQQLLDIYATCPEALCDRIDLILDALEINPGQAWLRRNRTQDPPNWMVAVRHRRLEYIVLWWPENDVPIISYIGPAF